MSSRQWVLYLGSLTLLFATACADGASTGGGDWTNVCVDADGDGFGLQCPQGPDCDDGDRTVHVGCGQCDKPSEGCSCAAGTQPVDCMETPEVTTYGSLLCKQGTRYCREGVWSSCEGIHRYESLTPPTEGVAGRLAGLLNSDASVSCGACSPDCHEVSDVLMDGSASAGGNNVAPKPGGGLTLVVKKGDGGFDAGVADAGLCIPDSGYDDDCDGLPNALDPYPSTKPFGSDHGVIFMDLEPGESGEDAFDVTFKTRAADVYFYLDMTDTMTEERDNLIANLTSGNFLPGAGASINCADRDFNGLPDNHLKTAGVAGNIACLIRDGRLGAGWFRDIPFSDIADDQYVMFEHRQDITTDFAALKTALEGFQTDANNNYPEGGMQGLYSIASGLEVYAGWDRPGIPKRTGCPANTFGWPCFRSEAVPIVVHFTDYGMQSGPTTASGYSWSFTYSGTVYSTPLNYPSSVLNQMNAGTVRSYQTLMTTAESTAMPEIVSAVEGKWITYVGDTSKMASNHNYAGLGNCPSGSAWSSTSQGAPDAVFRFTVGGGSPKDITISTRGSRFDTSLWVRRVSSGSPISCTNDISSSNRQSEITLTLNPNDYYVVLKGRTTTDKGMFQLTLGEKSKQTTGQTFGAKKYPGSGGVREALLAKGVRVITVNSSTDPYLDEQSKQLSNDTSAIGTVNGVANKPLTFRIDSDGSGLGTKVVEAVNSLVNNLAMDVSVRLVDQPPTPFKVTVTAIDQTTDLCGSTSQPPLDKVGNDNIPDTHINCRPGATPRFKVAITNPPAPNNVLRNDDDPKGGWNMRLQLIGTDTLNPVASYVVDEIPVYIIPQNVRPVPAPDTYPVSGYYEQIVDAVRCTGTDLPNWKSLSWSADVPSNTMSTSKITWEICGGDTDAEAASCTLRLAGAVTSGAACTGPADCPNGYCDAAKVCHYVKGPSCAQSSTCGKGGVCVSSVCQWTVNPIDIAPVVSAGMQGLRKMRVRATLDPTTDKLLAPSVFSWGLTYECSPNR